VLAFLPDAPPRPAIGTPAVDTPAASTPAAATPTGAAAATLEGELASVPGLSVGIVSATQGGYTAAQFLLDITQGARIAASAYAPVRPPPLSLRTSGTSGTSATVVGWPAALRRADDAPQLLRPGLLATQIPGGAAYVGVAGADDLDGIVAADGAGRIASISLGSAPTLLRRIAALRASKQLVVADLPGGEAGRADLRALSTRRATGELLLVLQRARAARGHELLWAAAAGLAGGGGRTLSSATTNERGLIATVDIAPTILRALGVGALPADMRGDRMRTDGALHVGSLRTLMARLRVVGGRRLTALGCLLGAWALLLLLAAAPWPGRGVSGGRDSRTRLEGKPARGASSAGGAPGSAGGVPGSARARAWALRVGALGVLWAPVAVLIPAALAPSAGVEYLTIALACVLLGALTDALLPWPRAPLAPALLAVAALTADALAGTQLLLRSLLGPNPILGARFYGIGNELKSALAVLVLAAVAAALFPARQGRRAAATMALAGVLLAAVEGSARIGAGVGGVILVSAGFAVASVMLLPGTLSRRRALIVLLAPVVALVALAALDLVSAHGSGHYTGSILHARSAGDLRDVLVRRYKAAWDELRNHVMPLATALALLCAWLGLRRQDRLLAPLAGDPAWRAALVGGVAAGVVGALVEDSGPVLLVVAVFVLGCVLSYLWGRPAPTPSRPDTSRAARSRARRPAAEPSR
jgi:hypothetical protein